jgi:hypothetical protein
MLAKSLNTAPVYSFLAVVSSKYALLLRISAYLCVKHAHPCARRLLGNPDAVASAHRTAEASPAAPQTAGNQSPIHKTERDSVVTSEHPCYTDVVGKGDSKDAPSGKGGALRS